MTYQSWRKMRNQILLVKFYKSDELISSHSLIQLSFDNLLTLCNWCRYWFLFMILKFCKKLCSQSFHTDSLWTLRIKRFNINSVFLLRFFLKFFLCIFPFNSFQSMLSVRFSSLLNSIDNIMNVFFSIIFIQWIHLKFVTYLVGKINSFVSLNHFRLIF